MWVRLLGVMIVTTLAIAGVGALGQPASSPTGAELPGRQRRPWGPAYPIGLRGSRELDTTAPSRWPA